MEKERITILMVTPNRKDISSISLRLFQVRIAFFTLIGLTLLAMTSFMTSYIFYKKASQKKELSKQLVTEIDFLSRNLDESEIAKKELEEKFMEIEGKLIEMQELLAKKGIKKELSVGGSYIAADGLNLSYVDFIDDEIDDLFDVMTNFPVGKPLSGEVNSTYGYRKDPFNHRSAFHSGIDIEAKPGQAVVTTADGVVDHADWKKGYGKTVIVKHKGGYETLYGHLSEIEVKKGQEVKSGDIIGYAGSTGRSTGTHVHYEVIRNGKNLNPAKYLSLR
jgi:murein DD-endopeptidase MepM/ murein hydrolase activator NlpD